MLARILSLVALITLITLLAIGLPTFINSFNTNPSVPAIVMSGFVVLTLLVCAIMLLLFGVLGMGSKAKAAN
jgi:putative exporter of polyketide antibiotics